MSWRRETATTAAGPPRDSSSRPARGRQMTSQHPAQRPGPPGNQHRGARIRTNGRRSTTLDDTGASTATGKQLQQWAQNNTAAHSSL